MSVEEDTKTSKNGNMIIEFDCPQTEEKTVFLSIFWRLCHSDEEVGLCFRK